MIPDIQRVVGDFLRENGYRAVSRPPSNTKTAWILITEIATPQAANSSADEIVTSLVQLDCYAGEDVVGETHGTPEASGLCRAVRALLQTLPDQELDDAQVSAVRVTNQLQQRDTDFKVARDRWILDVSITARALEPAS